MQTIHSRQADYIQRLRAARAAAYADAIARGDKRGIMLGEAHLRHEQIEREEKARERERERARLLEIIGTPKRKRQPSIATLIRHARGPVRIERPDGTVITIEREGTNDIAALPDASEWN